MSLTCCVPANPTFAILDFTRPLAGVQRGTVLHERGLCLRGRLGKARETRQLVSFMSFRQGDFDASPGCCGQLFLVDRPRARVLALDLETNLTSRWLPLKGGFTKPHAIAVTDNRLYLIDADGPFLRGYDLRTRRPLRTHALAGYQPELLAAGQDGVLYLARARDEHVTRMDAHGKTFNIGSGWLAGYHIRSLHLDRAANLHVFADNGVQQKLLRFRPDGGFSGANPVYQDYVRLAPGARVTHLHLTPSGEVFGVLVKNQRRHLFHALGEDPQMELLDIPIKGPVGGLFFLDARLVILDRVRFHGKIFSRIRGLELRPLFTRGAWFSPPLDSGGEDTTWHKLLLEAAPHDQTRTEIFYHTGNAPLSDPEAGDIDWIGPLRNPSDALIQAPPGRFLQLKIRLTGFHGHTPLLRRLRVYFPRHSWLAYLPAVYSEAMPRDRFPERFLAIFQTLFEEMEDRIDNLPAWLDREGAPAEALPALAGWLDLDPADRLDEAALREEIRLAPHCQRLRGTRRGLEQRLARLLADRASGARPSYLRRALIVEKHQLQALADEPFQERIDAYYGSGPHGYCLLLDPVLLEDGDIWPRLRKMVDAGTPAHANAHIEALARGIIQGRHVYLGINTHIQPTQHAIGVNTVLRRSP